MTVNKVISTLIKAKYLGCCGRARRGRDRTATEVLPAANKDYFGGWVTTLSKHASGHVWPLQ